MDKKTLLISLTTFLLVSCSKKSTDDASTPTTKEVSYVVSTYAGGEQSGKTDGKREAALFNNPIGLAFDSNDNLYIADASNYAVRVIDPNGVVSTIDSKSSPFDSAPNRVSVGADNEVVISTVYPRNGMLCKTYSAKNGLKDFIVDENLIDVMQTSTVFKDSKGNYYFFENTSITKINVNGSIEKDYMKNIEADATQLDGNIVFVDKNDSFYMLAGFFENVTKGQMKIISTDKTIQYLNGDNFHNEAKKFNYGDGVLPKAHIGIVTGLCVDKTGVVYFIEHDLDVAGYRVRKIDLQKNITTLAGGLSEGYKDGAGNEALFNYISGIAVDSKGSVFVTEGNRIRKISAVK